MEILQNVSLKAHSTMRLGGTATYLCIVQTKQEVAEAVQWAVGRNIPVIMVGGGSNIFWRDSGFDGLVIVNQVKGYQDFAEDDENHYITAGSGESWDIVVEQTVRAGLTGIECLSLIPGTVGGTPVQNVGAYGQDIAQTLVSVEAYDKQTGTFILIPSTDCGFGYRTSRFKTSDKGRFFITGITLHLRKGNLSPPFYAGLERYLQEHNIADYSPQNIRDAVIAIRSSKLPDPANVANNGSFFANPIIDAGLYTQIAADSLVPVPHWEQPDGTIKLAAAWLIEQVGYKDMHDPETGMATWPNQPLVLINENAQTTSQLLTFRNKIVSAVEDKFHIKLEQEPELLP